MYTVTVEEGGLTPTGISCWRPLLMLYFFSAWKHEKKDSKDSQRDRSLSYVLTLREPQRQRDKYWRCFMFAGQPVGIVGSGDGLSEEPLLFVGEVKECSVGKSSIFFRISFALIHKCDSFICFKILIFFIARWDRAVQISRSTLLQTWETVLQQKKHSISHFSKGPKQHIITLRWQGPGANSQLGQWPWDSYDAIHPSVLHVSSYNVKLVIIWNMQCLVTVLK